MSVASVPATLSRLGGRSLKLGLAAGVIVAAATAGLLLGGAIGGGGASRAPQPATAPQTITHDGVLLRVPSGWARADAESLPGFHRPLGLRNANETLRASVEVLPATSGTLLPAAYYSALPGAPKHPEATRLASGRQVWRYRFARHDGSVTFLYTAPTTGGVATVACTTPSDGSVPAGCEALASAVTVPDSRALEPGTRAAFYSSLPAAVSALDSARARGTDELAAATRSTGQALAADRLARAHKVAGAALAPLTSEDDSLSTGAVGALTATATAYADLASAARARSPQPYADARRAVSGAEADLRRVMAKVATAASAASRTATAAATKPRSKPAARARPATSEPATAKPAASKPHGTDLTVVLVVLVGIVAILLAILQTVRTAR